MSRRVLLVAPLLLHAPANPRGIRGARLIEGLAERGWEVDVTTFWRGEGEPPDPGCRRLYACSGGNPYAYMSNPLLRLGRRSMRYLRFDPDGLSGWVRDVTEAVRRAPASERPDVVLALGLPVSGLIAGAEIAAALDVPLVNDLGDRWPARGPIEQRARSRALGAGAALITTTPALAENLEPDLSDDAPVLLIPAGGVIQRRPTAAEPPLFVHMGVVTGARLPPEPVWEVLARLHREGRIEFRSHSIGWRKSFDDLPHPHLPLISHPEAVELTGRASCALVLGNTNHEQLPSKAFEIACTQTWALCVSELDGDPALALLEGTSHAVPTANDTASIERAVEEILARERRRERPTPAPEHTWARRNEQIDALLQRVTS